MVNNNNAETKLSMVSQVEIYQPISNTFIPNSKIQQSALNLYDLGFNIMPIPRVGMEHAGKKPPYGKFSILFTTRLGRSSIPILFEQSNLAVICGRLSNNLFILDCDSRNRFDSVGQELKKYKIEAWITRSARGGHYWLLCSEGEVKNANPLPDLDILGNHKYIVAPPSVHPTGLIYQWNQRNNTLPPNIKLDQLPFLEEMSLINTRRNILPQNAQSILVDQDTSNFDSNSEAELSAAMSLAKAGYSEENIISVFEMHQPAHYSSKKNPTEWFERHVIPQAFEYTNSTCNKFDYFAWVFSRPWPGRTGETDKRVFLALCARRQLAGRKQFRASVREVAELANIDKDTADRSIKRLLDSEMVTRVGSDPFSGANRYVINPQLGVP